MKLGKLLDKPNKKFMWWKDTAGKCCGGHQVFFSDRKALLRCVDGTYEIRLRRDIFSEPPQDVSEADATTIINRLPHLLRDFETTAVVRQTQSTWGGWSNRTVVHEVTVATDLTFSEAKPNQVRIPRPWDRRYYIGVNISALKSVAIGGETSGVGGSLREELAQVRQELEDAGVLQTTLQKDLEEAQQRRNQVQSELDASKTRVKHLAQDNRTKTSRIETLEREKSRLSDSKRSVEKQLSSSKRTVSQLEAQASLKERTHHDEVRRRDAQIGDLKRKKASNEETIRLWSKRFNDLKDEKSELQNNLNEQLVLVRRLQANEEAYQRQEKCLVEEMKKNESLVADNARLHAELSNYRVGSLESPFREINFVCELANLRSQQHDSALDACELLRLNEQQSFALLWRVFMFCYEYFENRMVEIRRMLNMNASDALDRLFIARMQDNYKAMGDPSGLEDAFVEHFEGELRSLVSDRRMVGYLRECGKLCWCVVLTSSPQLEFRPRVDDIVGAGEAVAFDSTKFCDHTGNMGRGSGVVDQYVLPGLYRVDSDAAVVLPCVRAHKPRATQPRMSSEEKPREEQSEQSDSESDPLANMREELKPVEALILECRSYKVRTTLKKLGINLQKADIAIGCAEEGCDYVFASNFKEYTRLARNSNRLVCGENEEHEGAKILSISGM